MRNSPSRYSMSAAAASSRRAASSPALLDHLVRRAARRHARDGEEARAAGEAVAGHEIGVALHHLDPRRVDAELLREELHERRGVALAVVLHARIESHFVARHLQPHRVARPAAAALDVHRQADAAQLFVFCFFSETQTIPPCASPDPSPRRNRPSRSGSRPASGTASSEGWMKLRRRSSSGARPSSRAATSIGRSSR